MGYKPVILDEAKREYASIVEYLVKILKNPQAATNFMDEFDRQILLVCENPEIFALSRLPELACKGYRTAFINKYIMLYKTQGNTLFISHIFHQSQDYARLV